METPGQAVVVINRAPVLTLWAAVVAQKLGFDEDASLSIGRALAGLSAQSKGRMMGIFRPAKEPEGGPPEKAGLSEEFWVEICGRAVPAKNTEDSVRETMEHLARCYKPERLADAAYSLYEKFRPKIPTGRTGWGAKGKLDLNLVRSLAEREKRP